MGRKIISLLTDFGLRDPYVAEMKAVILSLCPKAEIVDISHKIEKFNIRMGAFVLASVHHTSLRAQFMHANQGSAEKLYKAKVGDPIRIQSQSHG